MYNLLYCIIEGYHNLYNGVLQEIFNFISTLKCLSIFQLLVKSLAMLKLMYTVFISKFKYCQ